MITPELMQAILDQYRLQPYGAHGVYHWARVLENGRLLAARVPGARLEVVTFFAVFHDSRRENEGHDYGHGKRGAELASQFRGRYFDLSDEDFSLLVAACREHTGGRSHSDPSVQVCWDSDRLDLNRVRIPVDPRRLLTGAARDPEVIAWADERARHWFVPDLVAREWGLDHNGSHA